MTDLTDYENINKGPNIVSYWLEPLPDYIEVTLLTCQMENLVKEKKCVQISTTDLEFYGLFSKFQLPLKCRGFPEACGIPLS